MNNEPDLHTDLEALNAMTWEDLNPDWREDGDLTPRFAKSEFDNCPSCGKFEQIEVYVATEDEDVAVGCRPCQWQCFGDCPTNAIKNWNTRVNPNLDRLKAEVERLRSANRYALATFRTLEQYTFEDSDHGLLITEAVNKLEALASEGGEKVDEAIQG